MGANQVNSADSFEINENETIYVKYETQIMKYVIWVYSVRH